MDWVGFLCMIWLFAIIIFFLVLGAFGWDAWLVNWPWP